MPSEKGRIFFTTGHTHRVTTATGGGVPMARRGTAMPGSPHRLPEAGSPGLKKWHYWWGIFTLNIYFLDKYPPSLPLTAVFENWGLLLQEAYTPATQQNIPRRPYFEKPAAPRPSPRKARLQRGRVSLSLSLFHLSTDRQAENIVTGKHATAPARCTAVSFCCGYLTRTSTSFGSLHIHVVCTSHPPPPQLTSVEGLERRLDQRHPGPRTSGGRGQARAQRSPRSSGRNTAEHRFCCAPHTRHTCRRRKKPHGTAQHDTGTTRLSTEPIGAVDKYG